MERHEEWCVLYSDHTGECQDLWTAILDTEA